MFFFAEAYLCFSINIDIGGEKIVSVLGRKSIWQLDLDVTSGRPLTQPAITLAAD